MCGVPQPQSREQVIHYTDPLLLCSLSGRIVFTVVRPADPCIVLRRRILDPIILGTIKQQMFVVSYVLGDLKANLSSF